MGGVDSDERTGHGSVIRSYLFAIYFPTQNYEISTIHHFIVTFNSIIYKFTRYLIRWRDCKTDPACSNLNPIATRPMLSNEVSGRHHYGR